MTIIIRSGEEDAMLTLSRMVNETTYDDLPVDVISFAKKHILDTLGCIIGGSAQEGIPEVVHLIKDKGGKAESFLPFYGGKVPASEAAFALGPMARAIDMGDLSDGGHSSEYTLPVILAAASLKSKVSGKEFITAFVVGQELLIRIGLAFNFIEAVANNNEGGHYMFGSTAAVGKLLGLTLEELQNALGIANAMTQHWEMKMYDEASLSVRIHHGFVAQDAINICLLAKQGITGPHSILLGDKGFFNLHAKWDIRPDELWDGLGEEWKMTKTRIKYYASCNCTHTAVESLLTLMRENKFEAEQIESIHVDENVICWKLVCTPMQVKLNPRTVPECQFSLPFALATAAVDKRLFIDAYQHDNRYRNTIRDMMSKITMTEDKSLTPITARVGVRLKDGKQISKEVADAKGYVNNPLTGKEIIEKFKWMIPYSAYKLSDATVDELIDTVLNLESVDDICKKIIYPLTPRT